MVVLVTAIPSRVSCWDVETVYGGGFAAGDTSLALSTSNVPSISYAADGGLYLATKVLGGWDSEYVAPAGYGGGWSSLAFDHLGQPCIAFIDSSDMINNYLKYACESSGTWTVETIEDVGWLPDYVSLAFNPTGQACIAYCKTVSGATTHTYVSHARRIALNTWAKENITEVGDVTGPSMLIDGSGKSFVIFCDSATGYLELASRSGTGSWTLQTLAGNVSTPAIGYTSVALQPSGLPAVSYFLRSSTSATLLKYASQSGVSWTHESVVTLPVSGSLHCSLCVRRGNMPVIGYYDPSAGFFTGTRRSISGWLTEAIDGAAQTGLRPCLKLDTFGNVNASYFDSQNFNVKYAWSSTPVEDAKLLQDGQSVEILGLVATSASGELSQQVYAETPDRTCGIQLCFTGSVPTVARGMVLDIQGPLTTVNGERAISNPTVNEIGLPIPMSPLALTNMALGGGGFGYVPGPPATGQRGITGASGLNNIGLLVTTWGAFAYVNGTTFTVDDGSGVVVKCVVPAGVTLNPMWHYVRVTGLSSCEISGSELHRLLRVRAASDITAF